MLKIDIKEKGKMGLVLKEEDVRKDDKSFELRRYVRRLLFPCLISSESRFLAVGRCSAKKGIGKVATSRLIIV